MSRNDDLCGSLSAKKTSFLAGIKDKERIRYHDIQAMRNRLYNFFSRPPVDMSLFDTIDMRLQEAQSEMKQIGDIDEQMKQQQCAFPPAPAYSETLGLLQGHLESLGKIKLEAIAQLLSAKGLATLIQWAQQEAQDIGGRLISLNSNHQELVSNVTAGLDFMNHSLIHIKQEFHNLKTDFQELKSQHETLLKDFSKTPSSTNNTTLLLTLLIAAILVGAFVWHLKIDQLKNRKADADNNKMLEGKLIPDSSTRITRLADDGTSSMPTSSLFEEQSRQRRPGPSSHDRDIHVMEPS